MLTVRMLRIPMKLKIHLIIVKLCTMNVTKNTQLHHPLNSLSMAVPFDFYNFAFPFFLANKHLEISLFKDLLGFLIMEFLYYWTQWIFILWRNFSWRKHVWRNMCISIAPPPMAYYRTTLLKEASISVQMASFSVNITQMLHQRTMADFSSDIPSANQLFINLVPLTEFWESR